METKDLILFYITKQSLRNPNLLFCKILLLINHKLNAYPVPIAFFLLNADFDLDGYGVRFFIFSFTAINIPYMNNFYFIKKD